MVLMAAFLLAACSSLNIKKDDVQNQIDSELKRAAQSRTQPASPEAVNQALLPPLTVEMPQGAAQPIESRFDLVVNNAPASQVFMAMVSGTRYSMLVNPEVKETISVNLKNVTLTEALDAILELYGYGYRIQGTRIYIAPITIQTRVFQVDYLAERRQGRADVRVTGSIQTTNGGTASQANAPQVAGGIATGIPGAGTSNGQSIETSRVTTTSDSDLWVNIKDTIHSIIGNGEGRNVVINSQAGVILVQALPSELRSVEQYLKAMSLMIERQVMLEAKIVQVTLSNQFSTGVNWAAFKTGPNSRLSGGVFAPGTVLRSNGSLSSYTAIGPDGALLPGSQIITNPAASLPISPDPLDSTVGAIGSITSAIESGATVPSSLLGLAFQTGSFATLLNFLESQGAVHVLSSPRIATLNNQKAIIKVGTDEFFVTNVSTTTTAVGTSTTVSPTITVEPFFSGIALDVTPQISEDGQITLHIHPSITNVVDKTKTLNLGTLGTITLPLASSSIDESDTIVRVQDGTIAAIGGLMTQQQNNSNSGLPVLSDLPVVGGLFGSRSQQLSKTELVILLKPTIIKGDSTWQQQAREASERMQNLSQPVSADKQKPAENPQQ